MSRMSLPWIRNFVAIVFALSATACGLLPEVKDDTAGWSAERLYQEAHEMMTTGNYTRAVKLFDTLEGRFPYGRYAQQAILESAFANWRANEQATAIAACDRFIRTYPNHPNVDYAYYLKGLVNFREDQGLFGYVVEQDLSERDPKMTKESFGAFKELVTLFPDSKYAADSIVRMRYLTNALGGYEVHVAEYYYRRGAYIAAVNRAQAALVNYPRTPSNEDALILLVKGYDKLGMTQLHDDAQRVRAVLEATTDEDVVIADANGGWRLQDAVVAARLLEGLDRVYFEQPCPTLEECVYVRRLTSLPMVLDEVIDGVPAFLRAWREDAMEAVNLKISKVGGLTRARQLRELAETLGISLTIEDTWGGDIVTAAVSHLAASVRPELLFTVSFMNDWTNEHVAGYQPRSSKGVGHVPDGPGLGIEVDVSILGDPIWSVGG